MFRKMSSMFLVAILLMASCVVVYAEYDGDTGKEETPYGELFGFLRLDGYSDKFSVEAYTRIEEECDKVIVKVEAVANDTGDTLLSKTKTTENGTKAYLGTTSCDYEGSVVAYGTHEVRHTKSYAFYTRTKV